MRARWEREAPIAEAIRLEDGAIPQSMVATTNPDRVERKTTCRRLSRCVDLAYRRRWEALSCGMCPIVDPQSTDEQRQDMVGMANLLRGAALWRVRLPVEPRGRYWRPTKEDE